MPPRRPHIVDLEWDENNERHVEEHIDPWLIQDLLDGGDWFAFRNYQGHPPEHRLFVGQTPAGIFVTRSFENHPGRTPASGDQLRDGSPLMWNGNASGKSGSERGIAMARRAIKSVSDPFTPITSEAEWDEKGWARESEPLTAAPELGAMISIRVDPEGASCIRRAARLSGMTMSEFVRHAAVQVATKTVSHSGE